MISILTIFFAITTAYVLWLFYRYIVRSYLIKAYYRSKGVPMFDKWVPIIGDTPHFIEPEERNEHWSYDHGVRLMNTNPEIGMIYFDLLASGGPNITVTSPELADELLHKVGNQVDKSNIFKIFAARFFTEAFINLPTQLEWKEKRTAYQPAFSHQNLKKYTKMFAECAQNWVNSHKDADKKSISMESEFFKVTLDIIGKAAFGNNFSDFEVPYLENGVETKIKMQEAFCSLFQKSFEILRKNIHLIIFPSLQKCGYPLANKEFNINSNRVRDLAFDILSKREKEWKDRGKVEANLLDMLLKHNEAGLLNAKDTISEAILFIFAGHETTARTLTVFMYRIHQNPEIVQKIRDEIKRVIFEDKEDVTNIEEFITHEKIQALEYTTLCIKESLRIDPPAPIIQYKVKEDFVLNGIKIFKDTNCTPDVMMLHNNPLQWHSPREFIPERFDPTSIYYKTPSGTKRHPNSFIPFSAGQRNCIGQNFAMLEMKYLIVYMLSSFTFELEEDFQSYNDRKFCIGTASKLPMRMTRIR